MKKRIWLSLLTVIFAGAGCAHDPTVISDADLSLIERAYNFERTNRPIKVTPETTVLDVRAFFDYQLLRIPGSIFIDAREFNIRRLRGDDLDGKATQLARKLSLYGITPFSHVVVVGYGEKGRGEESLVALTLMALGVERTQVSTFEHLRFLATNKKAPERPNQRYWEPRVVSSVICPAHAGAGETFVIDVGSKGSVYQTPSQRLAITKIPWKDFVNKDDFSPNYKVKERLREAELSQSSRIVVRGPQAPVVTFALLQMGYSSACLADE